MAVFTPVSDAQLEDWLSRYDVGRLLVARGIAQGIENTNYFVDTERGSWVLTLIERIPPQEVPFYVRLMKHLAQRGIPCPEPATDRTGQLWSMLNGKPATLVTRLPGSQVEHPDASQCEIVGRLLARMHLAAQDFGPAPANSRGLAWWPGAFAAIEQEIRVELPGLDLPLVAYPDVVFQTPAGDIVLDHKVSAARPQRDELHDRLDLQLLALVHGWQESTGRRVIGWRWQHLLKLKSPALFDVEVPIRPEERERDLRRLAQIVNPTIRMMRAVLERRLEPPPTTAPMRLCGSCGFREHCALALP